MKLRYSQLYKTYMVKIDTVQFSDWNSTEHGSCSVCLTDYNFRINEELLGGGGGRGGYVPGRCWGVYVPGTDTSNHASMGVHALIKWNSPFRPVSTHSLAMLCGIKAKQGHVHCLQASAALSVIAATQLPRVSIWLVECNTTLYIIARQEL